VSAALCLGLWLHVTAGARSDVLWTQAALVFVLQSYLFVGLVALTAIDWEHQLLPHRLTIPLIFLGIFTAWVLPADGVWLSYHPAPSLAASVIGAVTGMLVIWAVFQIFLAVSGKVGIGGGDMFLLGVVGAWFGWQSLPLVLLLAALQGILWVAGSLFWPSGRSRDVEKGSPDSDEVSRSGRHEDYESDADQDDDELAAKGVAFGPFLAAASIEYVFVGNQLLNWLTGGALGG
jgi:prepilin signal peptidase PulO-like enzyme (type II secretory pathway)